MTVCEEVTNRIRETLFSEKVVATTELARRMGVSPRTVQRRLGQWSCQRSYSHNARYVALPENTCFDEYGIWQCDGVCFSRFGNLVKTVTGLVEASPTGLTNRELTERIHLNARSFLSQFARQGLLCAEKLGTRFHYFSADPSHAGIQRTACLTDAGRHKSPTLSEAAAIQLLLAWIKTPVADPTVLTALLLERQFAVTVGSVVDFLHAHDLYEKKTRMG